MNLDDWEAVLKRRCDEELEKRIEEIRKRREMNYVYGQFILILLSTISYLVPEDTR